MFTQEDTPVNEQISDDETLSLEELTEIMNEIEEQPHWRHIADKEMDYADGNQLDTELLNRMKTIGIPPAVEDRISPALLSIQGYELQTRTDWRVKANGETGGDDVADALNYKLNQAERLSKADKACSDAFKPQIGCGLGWVEVKREQDPFKYPYRCVVVHRNEIHWDMKSTEPDLSDARWLRRTRWIHPKRLMNAFPQHKELIETVGRYGGSWWQQAEVLDGGSSTGLQNAWLDARSYTISEQYWYKLLAEREQGSVRQQLEYLPYLLTLSSTMQQRNVIQRNALQKLIHNIVAYVKAWAFDRFGINLNLNPDDMLALSERMIKQIERQTSMDTVRQKYQGTSQWMTAPNGAKTRLTEQQWLQVRTPEFKNWFGDWENDTENASQVLDENGEPKVVYHGTSTEFNEFRKGHGLLGEGIYLTDSFDTADIYANVRGENGFVLPLFVNIRNAFKTTGNVSRDKVVEATQSGKYQGVVHHFDDHEYIVALESNQVKMAEGNTGTFNSESADIRFSRSARDIIDKLGKDLKGTTVQSIKDKSSYKFTDWLGISLSALGRRQLTEIYSKILPQLNKYNELAAQMDADKNDAGAEADSIVREWANLKDEEQLAELMHDATLAMIDPAKPYKSGDNKAKYQQLLHAYNNLTPEAQAMYKNARDAYKKHYTKVHQAIKERIMRAELSSEKKADLMKQMDDNFFNGRIKGVYFPLARFGKYVVLMQNQNGQIESVSRAETMAEAQRLRSELMQKYPHFKVDRVILDKEFNASRDGVGRGFMTSLFAEVDNLGLSTAEQAEFEDNLSQLYLSSMPDLSWAKHGIHRKGTAGFSQDARRAFAQNMFHGAGYLAKLRYGDQLAQQLDDMQKYASEQSKLNDSYDQPTAQRVIDEMNKRHDNLMNPKSHPLSSALTSLGFIYYLGLSPASALVNLSQTALVAYPIMGAKWDFDKAAKELLKASNDFRKGVEFHKVKWEGTKTDLYKTMSADISKFLSKDEKQAYDDAVARGVIDVTQAHDLAGIAQGEDSGVMWKTRPIMRAASVMFHHAERFNREVTFIAAYRLARKAGSNHESAFDQAVDVTYKGHFDYSSGNRPRIMQGNVAKVLLLFKQFGQNMIYTLARQTYQSIKAETNAERKEARKTLGAILAMHATFAGTLGLPMVGMLLSVASWMGGDDDDPWDAEVALRNYLAEAFGPTISTLLMKGAPRALTPLDMSGRVGINNLLLPDVQEGLEGKRWAESAMAGALGPVAGIGLNVAKGAQEISEGHNLRGVETMLPVFLKNFAKTYRYGEEGVQDKTGVSIMDEVSSMDLLVQGMGFSPSDVRTANEGKSAIYQLDKKLNERRGRLMALWSRAKLMDDQNEMDEIWEEIQGFNERNPSRRITRVNLSQSYKNRQRRIDRSEDGIYLSRNRQDARSAGYFAFGE
ncbi:PLxRFG domain-containing protein [Acinetobacter tandoii]|uniref:portal protein n=1 Tax=Acinetobacter tandoii TaxID=202954 RepID=UPI0030187CD8